MGRWTARLSGQRFNSAVQAALMASGLVLVDQAFVGYAVDHRNGSCVRSLGRFSIAGFNGADYFFHISARHGAQAGVVLAGVFVLACTLSGLRGIGHRGAPVKIGLNAKRSEEHTSELPSRG